MDYYEDVYLRRVNRYGTDYQSRVQGQREREFEDMLVKSAYRLDFMFDGDQHPGILTRNKQDQNQILAYLLTRVSLDIPNGTILMLRDKNEEEQPWMIWWLENIKASGYNKYIILKMTVQIQIGDGYIYGYIKGPGNSAIRDAIKSHSGNTIYAQNDNLYMLITSTTNKLQKDQYFEVTASDDQSILPFRVTDLDLLTTAGIAYISIDPVPKRDNTPAPTQNSNDDDAAFYWLNKGGNDGGS